MRATYQANQPTPWITGSGVQTREGGSSVTVNQAAVITGQCRGTIYRKCRERGIGRSKAGDGRRTIWIEPEEIPLLNTPSLGEIKAKLQGYPTTTLLEIELYIEDLLCERMSRR